MKVIWTEQPSPVGYVSALHEVRACLKQAFVHGHGGHAVYCQTYPADVHLSEVVVQVARALEHAVGGKIVQVILTDREGLSVEVLGQLTAQNVAFATLWDGSLRCDIGTDICGRHDGELLLYVMCRSPFEREIERTSHREGFWHAQSVHK